MQRAHRDSHLSLLDFRQWLSKETFWRRERGSDVMAVDDNDNNSDDDDGVMMCQQQMVSLPPVSSSWKDGWKDGIPDNCYIGNYSFI